jgi:hypothetical protein
MVKDLWYYETLTLHGVGLVGGWGVREKFLEEFASKPRPPT